MQFPGAPSVKSVFRVGVLGLGLRMNLDCDILAAGTCAVLFTIYIVLKQL